MKRSLTTSESIVGALFAFLALLPFGSSLDGASLEVLPPFAVNISVITDHLSEMRASMTAFEVAASLR